MTTNRRIILAGVILLGIYWIYSRMTAPTPIAEAVRDGKVHASVVANGNSGSSATITLSRPSGVSGTVRIVVPSGTVLYSGDSDSQRLILALPLVVILSDDTPSVTQDVKTFCLDEFAAIPTARTQLAFLPPHSATGGGTTTEETEPLHKLADCMASASQSDADKQLAVWAVSSDWLHKTRYDAVQFVTNGLAEQMAKEYRNQLKGKKPNLIRMAPGLSSADIDELIEKEYQDSVADVRRIAAARAEKQIASFIDHDKDMLKSCGYSTDDMAIFR